VNATDHAFIREVVLLRERIPDVNVYPFSIPALRGLSTLRLHPRVTFLVGENGSGKSTLIEAIAIAAGLNAEGGSRNFRFSTRTTESELHACLRLVRGIRRPRDGFFLRAESFFNAASYLDKLKEEDKEAGVYAAYGGRSLHEQSHGESFLALLEHRFGGESFYVLDEPEAALSPLRQLTLLAVMHDLVTNRGCQFIVATHSPIIMAYPGATIYLLSQDGIADVEYEDTEHFSLTRDFLNNRDQYFRELFPQARHDPRSPEMMRD
jgi:predicted ATPase